jgi:hypothetical protein
MKIEEVNINCLAKCCGVSPEYNPRGSGFFCPTCKKEKFGWGGTIEWHAGLWNTSFHKTVASGGHGTDIPFSIDYQDPPELIEGGWKYAKTHMSFHLPWQEDRKGNHDFVLFRCLDRNDKSLLESEDGFECCIDDFRCLKRLELMSLDGRVCDVEFPNVKGRKPFYAYLSRSWCTDGTWNYLLNLNVLNIKWRYKLANQLGSIGLPFPDFK